jgi:hypothetical protein
MANAARLLRFGRQRPLVFEKATRRAFPTCVSALTCSVTFVGVLVFVAAPAEGDHIISSFSPERAVVGPTMMDL